jgi:CheY-like chemotaxis protein
MSTAWAETILVVEDTEPIRRIVCAMLAQSGYRCLEAGDGAEALDVLETGASSVSLILTDMIMPKMTGAELALHVSRTWPELRIMFMSGYTDDPSVRTLEQSRALFLAKPFTAAVLMKKVREALDHPWTGLHSSLSGGASQ